MCSKNLNREYIKEVWEESRYTKPLDITRRIANDETITMPEELSLDHESLYGDWLTLVFEAFGVPLVIKKGEEPKKYDFFEDTFLTMCKSTRENGIWWIGSGENRRRDDDIDVPSRRRGRKRRRKSTGFDWEAMIDEATVEGESGSGEKFYDAEDENQGSPEEQEGIPAAETHGSAQQMEQTTSGVDPSGPTGRIS
ncbi:hypothetical protein Dimus_016382 [Dionaea muscipula]